VTGVTEAGEVGSHRRAAEGKEASP
jgi:hypothetical protein